MAESPFHRVLVALPFPAIILNSFFSLFGDTAKCCDFVQVYPSKSPESFDAQDLRNKLAASLQVQPERVSIRRGDLLDELLAHSAETHADLLLLTSGLAPKQRALSRRLTMKAPCSVWMIPEDAPAAVRSILVPVDFSSCSVDALRVAARVAAALGLGFITAAHVYFDAAVASYEGHQDVMRQNEESHFETFLSRIDLGDVRVRARWEESSHVAETLLRIGSEIDADLIVMGTRGRSRSAGILIGSETDHVLSKSTIPILAVKRSGATLGLLEALFDRRFRRRNEVHFG